MKVLIVEDITLVAYYIVDLTKKHLPNSKITVSHSLKDAQYYIKEEIYDLLLLDLNLNGKSGFTLLKSVMAESFQTIIITANRENAVTAFDYGVLDFISKPIIETRFKAAIDRFLNNSSSYRENLKYLSIKVKNIIKLIDIENIEFIKACGNYSEISTNDNNKHLHDKNLEKLTKILPDSFIRIHRSYVVKKSKIKNIIKHGGGKYSIELNTGNTVALSRTIYNKHFLNSI
ncbi:response regulator [Tenacibaculum aiptasiae]|uniref:Response regulator n=1 Tax=Tenacibaculum aiptasiae TaxID=426481 RepID=A0A7J5AP70_9FLAO|nr:LytTR family transcriptional regulator DNA-binding domain-containing protein [Tenacibaculum aiptasiae]KAB1159380.1 response regulator [Tenacibaculum aiptasiae]